VNGDAATFEKSARPFRAGRVLQRCTSFDRLSSLLRRRSSIAVAGATSTKIPRPQKEKSGGDPCSAMCDKASRCSLDLPLTAIGHFPTFRCDPKISRNRTFAAALGASAATTFLAFPVCRVAVPWLQRTFRVRDIRCSPKAAFAILRLRSTSPTRRQSTVPRPPLVVCN
jgi:hypothetical protein